MNYPEFFRKNKFLIVTLILVAILLFSNLGDRFISDDESFTALVGKTIVEDGYPNAYYNGVLINPKNTSYIEVGSKSVYTWSTWMQEYIAASVLLVGDDEFLLRFPFALFALASVILSYFFIRDMTKNTAIAKIALILMATSVTFYLHARQLRWYGLAMFFGIAMLYSYWLLINDRKNASLWFSLSSIFLFHSNYFIFFGVAFALLVHFLIFEFNKKNIGKFILPVLCTFLFTFPWFWLTGQLAKTVGATFNLYRLFLNLVLNYYIIFIFLFPFLFLLILLFFIINKKERKFLLGKDYLFVFIVIIATTLFFSIKADILPQIRYLVFMIPLFSLLSATVLYKIYQRSRIVAYILVLLLIFTNLLNLFPFVFMKDIATGFNSDKVTSYEKERFIENSLELRFLFFDYIYEITHDYTGTDEEIIDYVIKHGSAEDTFITNSLAFRNTFMFYTDLKEAKMTDTGITWVIPRKFEVRDDTFTAFMAKLEGNVNLSNYELIVLKGNEDRWADAPDPINHAFKTDYSKDILIYYLMK
jgi:hypothetical protein